MKRTGIITMVLVSIEQVSYRVTKVKNFSFLYLYTIINNIQNTLNMNIGASTPFWVSQTDLGDFCIQKHHYFQELFCESFSV